MPDLGFNLVSVGKLADAGIRTTFEKECVRLLCNDSDQQIGTGIRDKSTGLYMLPSPQVKSHQSPRSPSRQEMSLAVSKSHEASLWHRRLAHVNMQDLARVHVHTDGVPKISASSCNNDVCRACRLGKAHKLPFKGHFVRATRPGEIVHSDIVGPLPVSYPQRHRYLVTFLDDYSRHVFVAFMRHKSDVKQAFQEYRAHVEASVDDIPDTMDVHTTSKQSHVMLETGSRLFDFTATMPRSTRVSSTWTVMVIRQVVWSSQLLSAILRRVIWNTHIHHPILRAQLNS